MFPFFSSLLLQSIYFRISYHFFILAQILQQGLIITSESYKLVFHFLPPRL